MKLYAIITAAGSGSRMGSSIPKPLLPLKGKPVLAHILDTFSSISFEQITITCPADQQTAFNDLALNYNNVLVIPGGQTRAHSIYLALQLLPDQGLVLVHDGARPLATTELVQRVITTATEYGAAIPAIPLTDTIKSITSTGLVNSTISRNSLRRAQTPQGFKIPLLKKAYEAALPQIDDPLAITDDSSLIERLGHKVYLVDGEERNIKITRPLDLKLAELLLE